MGRAPCCDKTKVKRGPWSPEEDTILMNYIEQFGNGGNWIALPRKAGLKRCGKSCRLRWLNYLRPDIKRGGFTEEEDNIICYLYCSIGSRWSAIASQLPGRTDNDVKNHWNTKLKKKILAGKATNNNLNQVSAPIPEIGTCDYRNSTYLSGNSYYGTILEPSQVTFPGLSEVSDYYTSANSSYGTMSSSIEAASGLSISSSSTLEDNYVLMSANENVAEEEGSLDDFSFESLSEFLNGFDF